ISAVTGRSGSSLSFATAASIPLTIGTLVRLAASVAHSLTGAVWLWPSGRRRTAAILVRPLVRLAIPVAAAEDSSQPASERVRLLAGLVAPSFLDLDGGLRPVPRLPAD